MNKDFTRFAASFLRPLFLPCLLLLFWHFWAGVLQSPIILPAPARTFSVLGSPLTDVIALGPLLVNIGYTLASVCLGFGLCVLIAVPLGILMGYSRPAGRLFIASCPSCGPSRPWPGRRSYWPGAARPA